MRKLIFLLSASVLLVLSLLVFSFFYIGFSGHRMYEYNVYVDGTFRGTETIDKFVTEDKAVYKSSEKRPFGPGLPKTERKLVISKATGIPEKYTDTAWGVKEGSRQVLIEQKGNKTDLLYQDQPAVFMMKGFETGDSTNIFAYGSVFTYIPILEKYNYFRKGTQYFEVMVPVDGPVPVMRTKIAVRYAGDEYASAEGGRVEAERYEITAAGVPSLRLVLSKYYHVPLLVEIEGEKTVFRMSEYHRKFSGFFNRLFANFRDTGLGLEKRAVDLPEVTELDAPPGARKEDVFFKSGGAVLYGRMLVPAGPGPFPAVVLVPGDGPMSVEEFCFLESAAAQIASLGMIALSFNRRGERKSQGNFSELDDMKMIQSALDACAFLRGNPLVLGDWISLLGFREGGYLALASAEKAEGIFSVITVSMPFGTPKLQKYISYKGLGRFDEGYMDTAVRLVASNAGEITSSGEGSVFFMGKKVYLRGAREHFKRNISQTLASAQLPVFMIISKKDADRDAEEMEKARTESKGNRYLKIIIIKSDNYGKDFSRALENVLSSPTPRDIDA